MPNDEHGFISGTTAKFISTFGLGTLLAVYLIWFLTNVVNVQLTALQNNVVLLQNAVTSTHTDIALLSRQNSDMKSQLSTVNLTLQAICVNAAPNQNARNACLRTAN